MRKPFDVLAEELDLSKSRGDRTPVELFRADIGLWEAETRGLISPSKQDHNYSACGRRSFVSCYGL